MIISLRNTDIPCGTFAGDIYLIFFLQCLTVLQRLNVWLSGGSDLCVWSQKLDLLCKTSHLTDAGKNGNDSL